MSSLPLPHTPAGKALALPTQALTDAVAAEWRMQKRFSATAMPLTSLVYTALDHVEGNEDVILDTLLAYLDTDTLNHRADTSQKLAQRQQQEWDPILTWASRTFGAPWQITQGLMPLDQSPALHRAIAAYLKKQDPMRLAAALMLASSFSSLALTLAVLAGHTDALDAFRLSRLEEDHQAEAWGHDPETQRRAERMREEVVNVKRFLGLLEGE